MLPPSMHPNGKPYRWLHDGEPLHVDPHTLPLPGTRGSQRLYETLSEGPVPAGSRNSVLLSLGGLLRHAGLDTGVIESTLEHVNAERCDPPLPPGEVATIAGSLGSYPAGGVRPTSNHRTMALEVRLHKRPATEVLGSGPTGMTLPSLPLLGHDGYFIQGWGHLLSGYPKSGKTELLARCIQSWLTLGLTVHWLTEESESVWTQRLARWTAVPEGLYLTFALGTDPTALLSHAANGTEDVIILDTLRNLLGLEDENDNARVARALTPWEGSLQTRTRIYVHHDRKAGGEHGAAIAGGAAFLGVVDRALELKFDPQNRCRRRLEVHSRIMEAPDLLYELHDDGELVALGDPAAVALDAVQERLEALLSHEWTKTRALHESLSDPRPSLEQVRQALTAMAHDGRAERNPPLSEDARGHTVRWRKPQNLTSNGPP